MLASEPRHEPAPPEAPDAAEPVIVYCHYPYAADGSDEIALNYGDPVLVLEKDEGYHDGWWRGRNVAKQVGLFPSNFTTPENFGDLLLADVFDMLGIPRTLQAAADGDSVFGGGSACEADDASGTGAGQLQTPINTWSREQVLQWLESRPDLCRFAPLFAARPTTGAELLQLNLSSLEDKFDVASMDERTLLLLAVQEQQATALRLSIQATAFSPTVRAALARVDEDTDPGTDSSGSVGAAAAAIEIPRTLRRQGTFGDGTNARTASDVAIIGRPASQNSGSASVSQVSITDCLDLYASTCSDGASQRPLRFSAAFAPGHGEFPAYHRLPGGDAESRGSSPARLVESPVEQPNPASSAMTSVAPKSRPANSPSSVVRTLSVRTAHSMGRLARRVGSRMHLSFRAPPTPGSAGASPSLGANALNAASASQSPLDSPGSGESSIASPTSIQSTGTSVVMVELGARSFSHDTSQERGRPARRIQHLGVPFGERAASVPPRTSVPDAPTGTFRTSEAGAPTASLSLPRRLVNAIMPVSPSSPSQSMTVSSLASSPVSDAESGLGRSHRSSTLSRLSRMLPGSASSLPETSFVGRVEPRLELDQPDLSGWLHFCTDRGRHSTWKRHWCILSGSYLVVCRSQTDLHRLFIIRLSPAVQILPFHASSTTGAASAAATPQQQPGAALGSALSFSTTFASKFRHAFRIVPPYQSDPLRQATRSRERVPAREYYFAADSQLGLMQWVGGLCKGQLAAARSRKPLPLIPIKSMQLSASLLQTTQRQSLAHLASNHESLHARALAAMQNRPLPQVPSVYDETAAANLDLVATAGERLSSALHGSGPRCAEPRSTAVVPPADTSLCVSTINLPSPILSSGVTSGKSPTPVLGSLSPTLL